MSYGTPQGGGRRRGRRTVFARFLTDDGTESGDHKAAGDYSGPPKRFWIETQGEERSLHVASLLFQIQDASVTRSGDYGGMNALGTGLTLDVRDAAWVVKRELIGGLKIKTNGHFMRHTYDVRDVDFGAGREFLLARFSFCVCDHTVVLEQGERLTVTLNDDFSQLDGHTFLAQGYVGQREDS